jgi:2-keto-4-pentenoate hydratase/2-oxohepta-3-ene-1,7-dioic acid hydratase in catechol pathway
MKICHYNHHEAGIIAGDQVYPLGALLVSNGLLPSRYTMLEVVDALANRPQALECARRYRRAGAPLPLAEVKLLAPIENPPALWCAAANYKAHQAEMEAKMGSSDRSSFSKDDLMAEFFLKPISSIVGPGGPVVLPTISSHVDFECELCAVIGKTARNVSEQQALEHVFGYLICWDFSQREPWGRGRSNTRNIRKGFDTFTGLGPWIVTRDEIEEPQNLSIVVEQNGKVAMRAHTSDMICGLRDHIRFLSDVLTLRPGVLITTGTPAGVSKLSDGDHLKGTIDKIGAMEISVRAQERL